MLKRNLWKILLSLAVVAWAVSELLPIKNTPFVDYVRAHVTAKPAEFNKLLDEASARHRAMPAVSEFVALKQIGKERKIDLTQYFPDIPLESTLRNVEKRNDILLNELLHRSRAKLQLGLDLHGGVEFTLEAVDRPGEKAADANARKEKITKAIEIIGNRINAFGVAEPVIRQVGDNRISVQLPGLNTKDNPDIVDQVKAPARLDFRMVHPTLTPGPGVDTPPGYEILTEERAGGRGQEDDEEVFVRRIPEATGEIMADARAAYDSFGKPEVRLFFTKEGKAKFAEITRKIAEEGQRAGRLGRLAIVLDGKLYSAPTVKEEINSDSAQISGGSMTDREAITLQNVLNNPLDVELVVKEQHEVGPSLAADAISSGQRAAIIGIGLVAAFMITYYTVGGLIAVVTLAMNVLIILGVMASFGATMTLPGLAGIVLTMGMAVDANILIFERMREELKLGKSLKTAVVAGYDKAFTTIVDAHVTQLCICGIMIWLGTGPIKGFGITLAIGVFSTMFSVLITSHLLTEWLIESDLLKKFPMLHFLHAEKVDFVKYGKVAFIASWLVVLSGIAVVVSKGQKIYGIDFVGGDVISVSYQHTPDLAQVRTTAESLHIPDVTPALIDSATGSTKILRIETPPGKSGTLLAELRKTMPAAGFEKIGEESIGPAIGAEIKWNAIKALLASFVITLIYIAFRFEFGFGIGAVVASVHDILMTVGVFVIFGYQFNAPMVAAILSIAGYSINDTVVVFDRIREELKMNPTMKLRDVINLALNRVFSRSIMTSVTTFLAALALFVFGTGVMKDISFTFIVGIITGTFSSIYIAAPVFYWWHKGDRKDVERHHDIAPKYEWQGTSKAAE
ncbi:MAG TPA: protein translocase subunit SecD [Opitutaceae bacterium]|nr:protein translocase subunit SecD [Opitutaceae bacterium]